MGVFINGDTPLSLDGVYFMENPIYKYLMNILGTPWIGKLHVILFMGHEDMLGFHSCIIDIIVNGIMLTFPEYSGIITYIYNNNSMMKSWIASSHSMMGWSSIHTEMGFP